MTEAPKHQTTLKYKKTTKNAHVYGNEAISGFYIPIDIVSELAQGSATPAYLNLTLEVPVNAS
jgi:hypothetical protein